MSSPPDRPLFDPDKKPLNEIGFNQEVNCWGLNRLALWYFNQREVWISNGHTYRIEEMTPRTALGALLFMQRNFTKIEESKMLDGRPTRDLPLWKALEERVLQGDATF